MKHIYIALGSNVGNRHMYLQKAINLLQVQPQIDVLACSSIYETPPWGMKEQDSFYNALCKVRTELSFKELLKVIQHIETVCGRVRYIRWGPRTLDLDLVYCEEESYMDEDLQIPHPLFWERLFVLYPLHEVCENFMYQGQSVAERIATLPSEHIVKLPLPLRIL